MALVNGGTYTILNNHTGTVLEFVGNNLPELDDILGFDVTGGGWDGELNQRWQLGATDVAGRWTLTNLQVVEGVNHVLQPLVPPPPEVVEAGAPLVAQPAGMWQFFITAVAGGFTIRTNANGNPANLEAAIFAVNIVDGDEHINIFDDSSSVQLVPLNQAQVWSFVQPVNHPIQPGVYTIHNAASGTVLDLAADSDAGNLFVTGFQSHGGNNQKWRLRRDPMGFWKFENLAAIMGGHRFLMPELADIPPAGTRLIGLPGPLRRYPFSIHNIPGTDNYQIFSGDSALNIVDGAGIPPNNVTPIVENGAPVVLQNADAQPWALVAVDPLG